MEKYNRLYAVCMNDKNINHIVNMVRENIKLSSERSVSKCFAIAADIMKKNIGRLNGYPRDLDELKEIVRYLNKLCVDTITEMILKKYPELQINRRKQVSKEKINRELDVWGERSNHVLDRPHINAKKEYADDSDQESETYTMKPNDVGYGGLDDTGGFAPAFGNHLISNGLNPKEFNAKEEYRKRGSNSGYDNQRGNDYEQRMQEYINKRNTDIGNKNTKPETPDFTDDGSGARVREEKRKREMQNNMECNGNGMGAMFSGMPPGMGNGMMDGNLGSFDNDNFYGTLLGAGAPGSDSMNTQMANPLMNTQMANPLMNTQMVNPLMNTQMANPLMNTQMANPLMNTQMANPLMNTQMVNPLMNDNQFNTNPNVISAKTMQLNSELERKLMERQRIDLETNQPLPKQNDFNPNPTVNFNTDFSNMNQIQTNQLSINQLDINTLMDLFNQQNNQLNFG
jgi:hypothetical protein